MVPPRHSTRLAGTFRRAREQSCMNLYIHSTGQDYELSRGAQDEQAAQKFWEWVGHLTRCHDA
jgi:hypothetical protein